MMERTHMGDEIPEKESINLVARLPKNIRQIGQADGALRIYIEDYVMTFIKQTAMVSENVIMILFGTTGPVEGVDATFISGAVLLKNDNALDNETITCQTWDMVYEEGKKHFQELDVMGWVYISSQLQMEDMYGFMINRLSTIHKVNFPGNDKLMMVYDTILKEECFYRFSAGELKKQRGHFIYYERNDRMQEYMIEVNGSKSMEIGYDDEITRKVREVANKKQGNFGTIKTNKRNAEDINIVGKMYIVAMIAIVAVLGATAVKSKGLSVGEIKEAFNVGTDNESRPSAVESEEPVIVEDVNGQTPVPKETTPVETTKPVKKTEKPASEKKTEIPKDVKASVSDKKHYTIRTGDTLAAISQKLYGDISKVSDICKINNISDENMIHPGDKILLP